MYIQKLSLLNFRNYGSLDFNPFENLNILIGMNGQGKSAILEAMYMLATSKSHRTSKDQDLIKIGFEQSRTHALIKRTVQNDVNLEVQLGRSIKKIVKINTVKHDKIADIVGQLNAVIFSSSDIEMIKGEPGLRRRFLNLEVSQLGIQYIYGLGRYKRVIEQRNNLLKEIKQGIGTPDSLTAWDNQLARYGAILLFKRRAFVDTLSKNAGKIYLNLSGNLENLEIKYKSNPEIGPDLTLEAIEDQFRQKLALRRNIDVLRGTTSVGPHRDDLIITINNISAREFASQGQQRLAALSIKLAEIELIEDTMGESPVVLLDDVMAELDEPRRARILEMTIDRCQTFVTTTHLGEIDKELVKKAAVFEVKSGMVNAL